MPEEDEKPPIIDLTPSVGARTDIAPLGRAGAKPAHEVDLKGGIVLVLGAEGAGLRHLTKQTCDWMVRLPQLGTVESLNVSVAAGMLLYEAVRQRISPKP